MNRSIYGVEISLSNPPELDEGFVPIGAFNRAYRKTADKPFAISIENTKGDRATIRSFVNSAKSPAEADRYYADRLLKTLLWKNGGPRITVSGDENIYSYLKTAYGPEGIHAFDYYHNSALFREEVKLEFAASVPEDRGTPKPMGGHFDGCRIGLDAGASSIKWSAIQDGETLRSGKVPWVPCPEPDVEYHYRKICQALREAKACLPRVDAVGVSTAGAVIDNEVMASSLFMSVPLTMADSHVRTIYIRAVAECCGDVPFEVINDGDVTAIAGMISLQKSNVLGISMGSSEAGGYVDGEGRITGWFNELAFMPVDCRKEAPADPWSGDRGCGATYFSLDCVLRLARKAGVIPEEGTPAEQAASIQDLLERGDGNVEKVFRTIGTYLGHTLPYYEELYHMEHVLLLGGVVRRGAGERIAQEAKRVLEEEYPETAERLTLSLPDDRLRRTGQSVAAASLPVIEAHNP